MTPNEIRLWETCSACPEQYNAYVGDLDLYDPYPQLDMYTIEPRALPIGFLHLRHGFFFVDAYGEDGPVRVYEFSGLESDGIFEPGEREVHLAAAKQALANYFTDNE